MEPGPGACLFDEEEAARHPGQGLLARIVADHRNGNRLRVTVPSDWLGRLARQKAPGICRRLDYVLDTREFHPGLRDTGREKLGLQEKDFMLITAAENLGDSRKGLDLLRQAWSQLRKQKEHVNLRLGLVGRGGMGGLLNDSRVIWLGKSNAGAPLAMWMAAADLFVHPASLDNYPLVLQESQACGTPVLAFDRGGIRETFEPDRTGWLLADRSIPALVGKLREIIQTPGAAVAMRNRARERMLDAQAPGKFTAEWTALSATTSNGTFVPVGNPS